MSITRFLGHHLLVVASLFYCTSSTAAAPNPHFPTSNIPEWARAATIGGFDSWIDIENAELDALIAQRVSENVSILEVDSGLSNYLNVTEFQTQLNLLTTITSKAHAAGLKAVIYYPALEVTTPNGENTNKTMYKEHPEWVQIGLNGSPNVFYGSQEVWVDPGMESAWMSPNTGYKDYFIQRVKQLAVTGLDGIWMDVPIYLSTGAAWAGAEPAAAEAFRLWSIDQGLSGSGYTVPATVNWDSAKFRAWVRWRHENLADFINDVRLAALSVNPDFLVIVENFPTDYMDASEAGLDGNYRRSSENFLRVWEIDSVSNTKAMQYATTDEFSNKLTMYKWARAADRENPSWGFSYGNKPLDAGLTMAAALATGVTPFEAKTPDMVKTTDSAFRSQWFGFVQANKEPLLDLPRFAEVGVWYSSPTRDFSDYKAGGGYGMYVTTTPPINDNDWWSSEPGDSPLPKPHLGGYRGAAHALNQLHIPYKIISDPGAPAAELAGIKFLWLPSVQAISDQQAQLIKDFVTNGGVVLATGEVPGTKDELGNSRSESVFKTLFNLNFGSTPNERTNRYGTGVAIYNPSVRGADLFASIGNAATARDGLSTVEQLIRIHVDNQLLVEAPKGVFVEVAKESDSRHHLYVVNYSGLKVPVVRNPKLISIQYRAPEGYAVVQATANTPDSGQQGNLVVTQTAHQYYQFEATVDQFSLITLTLQPKAIAQPDNWAAPQWKNALRQEAAESGLSFVLNSMRHTDKPEPAAFGIYTNLINNEGLTEIYAHGHHVTAEHMGLALRTSACMGDLNSYDQSWRYVRDIMAAPVYNVVNWAVDRDSAKPLVVLDGPWKNSNAPLDDFRVLRGLLEGASATGNLDAPKLAKKLLTGLYWTSVTDRDFKIQLDFPAYPEGLVGYAWDWEGTTDSALTPPAVATGIGVLTTDPIPTDYNDLYMIAQAARYDPLWTPVLNSATDLLIASEINSSGLFYNGYEGNNKWTGDFENRDTNQGKHLKVIQTLWISLHLAEVSQLEPALLDSSRTAQASAAANRALSFFKTYYLSKNRVPEYLKFDGQKVPACTSNGNPSGCLVPNDENLLNGEVRIYALLARLAIHLGDNAFASTLIEQEILTDRISDPADPRYGVIGVSTAGTNDSEAWNILESTLTLCMEAKTGTPPATNTAPVAYDKSFIVEQGHSVGISVYASDIDGDPLTYRFTSQPQHGTFTNGIYTPTDGYTSLDTMTFVANDGQVDSNVATVTIQILPSTPTNQPPIAQNQSVTTKAGQSVIIQLVATDPDNNLAGYQLVAQPTHGTLTGTSPGATYTYSPASDYSGLDSFTFSATDGSLTSNIATVTIDVRPGAPVNTAPVASNSSVSTAQDTAVNIQLVASDADNNPLSYTTVSQPAHGSLSGTAPNLSYTPASGFSGSDQFSFKVNDGIVDSNTATVTITVNPSQPNGSVVSNPTTGMSMDGNFTDWSGLRSFGRDPDDVSGSNNKLDWLEAWMAHDDNNLYLSYLNQGAINTNSWWAWQSYFDTDNDPTTGYQVGNIGADYYLEDNVIRRYTGTGYNWSWVKVGDASHKVNGDRAEFSIQRSWLGNSENMRIVFIGENIAFNGGTTQDNYPDGAYDTNATQPFFEYTTIATQPPGENQAPVAIDQSISLQQDSSKSLILGATDADGDTLSFAINSVPSHGTINGAVPNLIYVADAGYTGPDSFGFVANDGQISSNIATVSIMVTATPVENQPPVASNQTITLQQDSSKSLTLEATDPNGDTLSYTITSGPAHGVLNGTLPNVTYVANANYVGADSFGFTANDGQVNSNVATVTITIETTPPVENHPPVAANQTISLQQDSSKTLVLGATDPDGDALSFEVTSYPGHGTLTGIAPNLTYAANAGYVGNDTISFTASDGPATSNTATVTINVEGTPSGNPSVSNPATGITIDGNLADWQTLTPFPIDPDDVTGSSNKANWQQAWVAHDSTRIYIAYVNHGPIDTEEFWAWGIYIDTNNNPNKGFSVGAVGAEYLIDDGYVVRKYRGNGNNWKWKKKGNATYKVSGNRVELSFPRSWIGTTTKNFRLGFIGDNMAFPGGSGEDHYPDGLDKPNAAIQYFSYQIP